ncbi:GerMN domain-containing protein [Paenibacillus sp. IB182496]|uniref:GerMN domain-containing protein n=1 Tax=Paenibacillus sabuli TaxID=2772509 RepID=A0A927BS39_9BACL|nr:GerMN domain-containing protein [Paenibacillus sabuli]MBD2844660.1 GerMN domain-containing protein [Paenibacillus sabuli]
MIHAARVRKAAIAAMMAATLTAATGCGVFGQQTSQQIDPPRAQPPGIGGELDQETVAVPDNAAQVTLYLSDRNGYIAPVTLLAPKEQGASLEQTALEMLVRDSDYTSQLPDGFEAVLPTGTEVNSVTVDPERELAIVDLSALFTGYNVQDERRIVESLTWTLTGFPGIEGVELWSEGVQLTEMPVDGFPLEEPLSRAVGINLERSLGVDVSRSMPVTLYFSAVSPLDEQYYVPVTRLVERADDAARAALEQLVAGPAPLTPLSGVMTPDVEVAEVTLENGVATVNLQDDAYSPQQPMPAEMLQSVILSVSDMTGAEQVMIQINGQSDVLDTNQRSYSEPVARPEAINALKS